MATLTNLLLFFSFFSSFSFPFTNYYVEANLITEIH